MSHFPELKTLVCMVNWGKKHDAKEISYCVLRSSTLDGDSSIWILRYGENLRVYRCHSMAQEYCARQCRVTGDGDHGFSSQRRLTLDRLPNRAPCASLGHSLSAKDVFQGVHESSAHHVPQSVTIARRKMEIEYAGHNRYRCVAADSNAGQEGHQRSTLDQGNPILTRRWTRKRPPERVRRPPC